MADVKWVKITTDMFDNRKIKYLRTLPDGNSVILIWIMLLTMAGRCNSSGMIFLTENIPYTTKMLADELNFEENTVVLALKALQNLGMIFFDGEYFSISNWEKYQNIDGLEKIKEQTKERVAKHREKKKLESGNVTGNVTVTHGNVTGNVTVTQSNAADKDKERELDKRNNNCIYAPTEEKKTVRHKYGEYENVLLSDNDLEKLKSEYPNDYEKRIERLSEYIASTGKSYKNHLATIRSWAKKDKSENQKRHSIYCVDENEDTLDDLF